MKKHIIVMVILVLMATLMTGCLPESAEYTNTQNQRAITQNLLSNQSTPTDIDYSIERHNLIKRAYWVNGQREKAIAIPNPIANMPLGYAVLLADNGAVFGRYVVDGKVTSLNSYLSPDSEYYSSSNSVRWLADVDGSFGSNQDGIFFFTTDGNYVEWTGKYFYSDIPVHVEDPILKIVAETPQGEVDTEDETEEGN